MEKPSPEAAEIKFPNLRNPKETLHWFWEEADFKILLPAIPMAIFVILNWQTSEWIAILGSFIATAIAINLLTAIARIFLLENVTATTYVLINTPSSFIISGLYLATSGYLIVRAAKKENSTV